MRPRYIGVIALAGMAVIGGCGDSTRPSAAATLRIVAGADATDTITAPLIQALVVEVKEGDHPLAGTLVRFTSEPIDPKDPWSGASAFVAPPGRNVYGSFAVDTTDDSGRAYASVQLGVRAGPAAIVIEAPDAGVEGTAHYTVTPGNPFRIAALPHDTAVYAGSSFASRSTALDRYGNPVDTALSYASLGPAAVIASGTVQAAQLGGGRIVASLGTLADTMFVAVIPDMTLGAADARGAIVMVRSDGSGYQVLVRPPPVGWGYPTTTEWTPQGTRLVFDHAYGYGALQSVSLDSVIDTLTSGDTRAIYPDVSPDGGSVYFSKSVDVYSWRIYRVHIDGSGEEELPATAQQNAIAPSLSPDGKQLVFGSGDGGTLVILGIASGEMTKLPTRGMSPAWSPDGRRIAYLNSSTGRLFTMAPDGSDSRMEGDTSSIYSFSIDWSPDSKWLIARDNSHDILELVQIGTNFVYPLPFTTGFGAPSWKP